MILLIFAGMANGNAQNNAAFMQENFETWDSSQGYLNPAKWYSLNTLTQFGYPATLERTTDAHSGNFAVLLESKNGTFGDLTGLLVSGELIQPNGSPDFTKIKLPFTLRPGKVNYYFKSDPEPGDTCAVMFMLTRWNAAMQKADTVGIASSKHGDSIGIYQLAEVNIEYFLPLTPDSAFFLASSSLDGFNPSVGSRFWIDDLSITGGNTGMTEESGKRMDFGIYPNPAQNVVCLKADRDEAVSWEITDMSGRLVLQMNEEAGITRIDISGWEDGVYLVGMRNRDGAMTYKKLILQ